MNDNHPEILYGAKAIADFLGLSLKQCQHRIEAGIVPTFKMPRSRTRCARPATLRAWLAEQERKAGFGSEAGA